jgi:rod shape-determining protein MreD
MGIVAVLVAVLAQSAVIPSFSIFGVQPNLVIVLLVAWMSIRGRREAFVLIPFAGITVGLLDSQALGLALLAFAPLILLTEVHELRLIESDLLPALPIVVATTVFYEMAILLTLALTGEHMDWPASILDVLVPAAIANVLLLLPVYALVRLGSPDMRGRQPMT